MSGDYGVGGLKDSGFGVINKSMNDTMFKQRVMSEGGNNRVSVTKDSILA